VYILDTDHMTILERGGPSAEMLASRLTRMRLREIATTIVTYEEQTRGWLAKTARDKGAALIRAYGYLGQHINVYAKMNVLPYDEAADDLFVNLRNQRVRLGTQDLKIAAIALRYGGILLTRNLTDFQRVPTLISEDWSI
jgi:tRNA(fMet)-specific endonuclease VapC